MASRYTLEKVEQGIQRFLELFRTVQSVDAEPEFADLCRHGCGRYAAVHGECFSCAVAGKPVA